MYRSHLKIWVWMNFYTIFRYIVAIPFIILTLGASIYLTFMAGPYLEYKLLPIADGWNIETAKVNDKSIDFVGVYHKIRNCRATKVTAYLTHPGESDTFNVTPLTTNIDTKTSRPLGWNNTTPWHLSTEGAGPGSEFFFVLDYDCHPLWGSKLITPKFSIPFDGSSVKMGDYVNTNQR